VGILQRLEEPRLIFHRSADDREWREDGFRAIAASTFEYAAVRNTHLF
jgi:D-serine dehydratase